MKRHVHIVLNWPRGLWLYSSRGCILSRYFARDKKQVALKIQSFIDRNISRERNVPSSEGEREDICSQFGNIVFSHQGFTQTLRHLCYRLCNDVCYLQQGKDIHQLMFLFGDLLLLFCFECCSNVVGLEQSLRRKQNGVGSSSYTFFQNGRPTGETGASYTKTRS